ncbi:MAG: phosphotransferase family protein [Chloroflexota bacterium]
MDRAVCEILGQDPLEVAYLDSGNHDVARVTTGAASYVLKGFEGNRYGAYEREMGMRECLRRFSGLQFPRILGSVELGETRYVLMEDAAGERLGEAWSRDHARAGAEMSALGRMLGSLHEIPVAGAERLLEREKVLFSRRYFDWMADTMAPYWRRDGQPRLLRRCYEVVTSTAVDEVVIHGDFGPHQVVVNSQGEWILIDFEYAALGAFADDLGGTEVRLKRQGYPNIEGFLRGYESRRGGSTAQYEPVRAAYKAYNLLAILTYCLAQRGEEPPGGELERLERLLASL